MPSPVLEVRVSRLLLGVLCVIGALFLLTGLDLLHFGWVLGPEFGADQPWMRWAFILVCLGLGGPMALVEAFLFLKPPVMLRVDNEFVSFGTGFGYRPLSLPRRALAEVRIFTQQSEVEVMGQRKIVVGGVELVFRRDKGIPSSAVTSAGLSYSDYTLRLFKKYMNTSPHSVVNALNGR